MASNFLLSGIRTPINQEIFDIADEAGTDVHRMGTALPLAFVRLFDDKYRLADLEAICKSADETKAVPPYEQTSEQVAFLRLTNHVLIPHLDSFIIQAARREEINATTGKLAVDANQFPHLAALTHYQVPLDEIPKKLPPTDTSNPKIDYNSVLKNPEVGHVKRIEDAILLANSQIRGFEDIVESLTQKIIAIGEDAETHEDTRERTLSFKESAAKANEKADRRIKELHESNEKLEASFKALNNGRKPWALGVYGLGKLLHGVPILEGLTHTLEEQSPEVQKVKRRSLEIRRRDAAMHENKTDISRYESDKKDVSVFDQQIFAIDEAIAQLQKSEEFQKLQKDETRQRAIAEAFTAKYILSFGLRLSHVMEESCKDGGIPTLDHWLDGFGKKKRLGAAVRNLATGNADSNDLSVIFAESNAARHASDPQMKILHEITEDFLKPNVAELYSHASKIDLIYQANLSPIGTSLHVERAMVRSEHDQRIDTLFRDAFGVQTQIHALSVSGATDVKRLFDFYLHRHGSNHLTDTKIRDGIVSGAHVRKGVSALSEEQAESHQEFAKTAQGFRQQAPDISDMFIRICGHEYFFPQAPNQGGSGNIMKDNPEAPAAYLMVNEVVNRFVEKMSFDSIRDYQGKAGRQFDNLIAQTFMDFFQELGQNHASDPDLGMKRAQLKQSALETGTHGFAFDAYTKRITKDALKHFNLFLDIYSQNLQKQLECAPEQVASRLKQEIKAIEHITTGTLTPPTDSRYSDHEALKRAYDLNHTFENVNWRQR